MPVDTQYAYAVARIRAIETKLLDKNKLDRMLDAKTPAEALKVLDEAGYDNSGSEEVNSHDYEKLLKEEQKKVYRLLKSIAPQPEVFNLFLYKIDYHNVKVILKSEFSGQENDTMLVDTGLFPVGKLKVMIKERSFSNMSQIMRQAIDECIDTYNRTGDPQIIDLLLDKACFKEMKESALKTGSKFIVDFVRVYIDLINIRNFLRVKKMNKSWNFLQTVLLDGGTMDLKFFAQKINDSVESFVDECRFTQYGDLCEEGLESYQATGSLTKIELLSDNHIMAYVKKAKYISLGIEPLIAYLHAKETELKNVGIIMVGKINNIPSEIIKERLRESYV